MMTLSDVYEIDPRAIERARRLEAAKRHLRTGASRRDVSGILHAQFGISRSTAWRIVEIAVDLVGPVEGVKESTL